MEPWAWAVLLKPFYFLLVWVLFIYPVTKLVERYMPEGWLKRELLRRRGEQPPQGRDVGIGKRAHAQQAQRRGLLRL